MAVELEIRIFREDQESLRAKNYTDLRPLNPGLNCYSISHASIDDDVVGGAAPLHGRVRHRGRGLQPRARRGHVRDEPPLRRRARGRRPRHALQERREGGARAVRRRADLHGQVLRRDGRLQRPHPPEPLARRRERVLGRGGDHHMSASDALVRRGRARDAAGAVRALRAQRQLLQALRRRELGADRRHLGHREPHGGAARDHQRRRRPSASRTACPAPTSTRTSASLRASPAACPASSASSTPPPPQQGNVYEAEGLPPLPRTLDEAIDAARRAAPSPATSSAMPSSTTTSRCGAGRSRSTAAPSPRGSARRYFEQV